MPENIELNAEIAEPAEVMYLSYNIILCVLCGLCVKEKVVVRLRRLVGAQPDNYVTPSRRVTFQ
jgi:hypothetical protein